METPQIKTFDVLAAAKGASYPDKEVVIYTDQRSAHRISELEKEIADLGTDQVSRIEELEVEIAELRERILETALTFYLVGISPAEQERISDALKVIEEEQGTEARNREAMYLYIAQHIVRVTNAEGAVDESPWDSVKVDTFLGVIPAEEHIKLSAAVSELTFSAAYFDAAVSADFLPMS